MRKNVHEIRDPIHIFIHVDSDERKVLDSRPFQRLRHIHQLALTHLVYPGATHRRFEHCLGVMELAGRVFDVVTHPDNIYHDAVREIMPTAPTLSYWKRVLRMAALCHDIGHLPFSHAAEKELLQDGWDHERLTTELIESAELSGIWKEIKVYPDEVAKLAVGPKKYRKSAFTVWEAILSEIIVGNSFGVDRMDYLLRDSHHAGVAYGKFDHFRLIDTIRILPKAALSRNLDADGGEANATDTHAESDSARFSEEEPDPGPGSASGEPTLGITEGGLHSAEALLLARYFMYTQLYFHQVRRIYDIHLKDFLKRWLPKGCFSTDLVDHLNMTDNEVTTSYLAAARDPQNNAHDPARRIVQREHYRLLYQRNPDDVAINPEAALAITEAARCRFGADSVQYDSYRERNRGIDFPVLTHDGRVVSCLALSDTLARVPVVAVDFVYIAPRFRDDAARWLKENLHTIIAPKVEKAP